MRVLCSLVCLFTPLLLALFCPPPPGSSGGKRTPKIYWVAVHPLQPQYVAVGTNTGAALLELDAAPAPLPAVPLPLRTPMQV